MPNWCMNTLVVSGEGVEAFAVEAGGGDAAGWLSLHRLDPIPDGGDASEHWGTKWDLDDEASPLWDDGVLSYHFSSAWSPPVEAFEHIAAKHPGLTFALAWHEGAMDFSGVAVLTGTDGTAAQGGGDLADYVVVHADGTGWILSPDMGSFTAVTMKGAGNMLDELWEGANTTSTWGLYRAAVFVPAGPDATEVFGTWVGALATGTSVFGNPVRAPSAAVRIETCLDNIEADPSDFADRGGDLIREEDTLIWLGDLAVTRRRELVAYVLANAWRAENLLYDHVHDTLVAAVDATGVGLVTLSAAALHIADADQDMSTEERGQALLAALADTTPGT